jgi:hypothetical protein
VIAPDAKDKKLKKIGGKNFHYLPLRLQRNDGEWVESHIFLTAYKGKLLKYRISLFGKYP